MKAVEELLNEDRQLEELDCVRVDGRDLNAKSLEVGRVEERLFGAVERDGRVELAKGDGATSVEGEMKEVLNYELPPGLRRSRKTAIRRPVRRDGTKRCGTDSFANLSSDERSRIHRVRDLAKLSGVAVRRKVVDVKGLSDSNGGREHADRSREEVNASQRRKRTKAMLRPRRGRT